MQAFAFLVALALIFYLGKMAFGGKEYEEPKNKKEPGSEDS